MAQPVRIVKCLRLGKPDTCVQLSWDRQIHSGPQTIQITTDPLRAASGGSESGRSAFLGRRLPDFYNVRNPPGEPKRAPRGASGAARSSRASFRNVIAEVCCLTAQKPVGNESCKCLGFRVLKQALFLLERTDFGRLNANAPNFVRHLVMFRGLLHRCTDCSRGARYLT